MSVASRTPGWTTLRRRALVPALACAAALALAAVLGLRAIGTRELADRLDLRARLLGHVVADLCATPGGAASLDRVVSSLGAEPEVDLIVVAGGAPARVLASTRHAWVGRPLASLADPAAGEALARALRGPRQGATRLASDHRIAFTTPATFASKRLAGAPGAVLVRLETARLDARRAAWDREAGLLLAILLIAGAVAAELALRRYVLDPVQAIAGVAERRRAGERDVAAPVLANDEIGRLAVALAEANRAVDDALDAKEAVRELEARTRLIVDTALDAVITIDSAGLIIDWNAQAQRTFGWESGEVLGRRLSEVIIPLQYRGAHDRGLARYVATGEGPVLGQRIEISALRRDGTEFPVELAITALRNETGVSFSAFVRDIGDRKQAEADLVQAKNAAQAASRAKSEFLATMSHEIRTPMNGVIGFTDLLLGTSLDEDQRDYAQTIRSSGHVLMALINDILDFSKIEAGRLDVERVPFDAREAAAEVVELLAAKAEERGLELVLDWPVDAPPNLDGDVMRFRQVLLNLTGNALKFTEAGTVTLRAVRNGGEGLRLEVRDTGIGIDPAKLPALFRKFTQADSSTTRRFGGTGLGLAISKQLVEMMGGTIGAESARGHGSIFWFTLPLASGPVLAATAGAADGPAHAAGLNVLAAEGLQATRRARRAQIERWKASAVPAAHDGAEAAAHANETSVRVLLAEDQPVNQKLALRVIARAGCVVDLAKDGVEACAMASATDYDVIFMDCHMPGRDGFEATELIRARESALRESGIASRHTPIVALTASVLQEDRERCFACGMDDFISKPFSPEDVEAAIARWSGAPASEGPARKAA